MKTLFATYWRGLASGTRNALPDRLLLALLIPLSIPYSIAQRLRAVLYRFGAVTGRRLPRPVVSIGNITVGGTGKTPVTAYIARFLMSQGLKVAVLSRGYGGTLEGRTAVVSDGRNMLHAAEECGDEPFLMASTVPGLIVVIGADRHAAGILAMEQLSPDIFLLDDGFQHLRLQRDLDILLLDCLHPFGNGWTLPAGMLREPRDAAARADLIIRTRCSEGSKVTSIVPGKAHAVARHRLNDAIPLTGGSPIPLVALEDRKVLACAGIAEPQAFFAGLRTMGLNVVQTLSLPDHAVYDDTRIAELAAALRSSGADCIITTEKDGVKLKRLPTELAEKTLLARLDLSIDDPAPLETLLLNLLQ